MSQVSKRQLPKNVSQRIFDIFIKTLLNVRNKSDAERLIYDLLTPTEQTMIAKRLSIALLLEKGYDQRTISDLLKVSTGTVSHVNSVRLQGSQGYKNFIHKIMKEESVTNLILSIATNLASLPTHGTMGTGAWKVLHKELKKKKKTTLT
jgi:uncharacterized protein YerC